MIKYKNIMDSTIAELQAALANGFWAGKDMAIITKDTVRLTNSKAETNPSDLADVEEERKNN